MPALMPDVVAAAVFAAGTQPTLRGEVVTLRPWSTADAPAVHAAYRDPDIQRWHVRSAVSEDEAAGLIERWCAGWSSGRDPQWAVTVGDVVAGRIGLRHMSPPAGLSEVAYWTVPRWRGRGVTPGALAVLTRWAFGAGFHRLEVSHSVRNLPSCRAATKAGFAPESVKRSAGLHSDGWHDVHVHVRIRGS
ncbi:GNAT family N-acetyltransferase [Nocardia sp. NBC_01730]|uniref:GNAT family N-acetyltransferase n=1 Tax=Nocardia sp. NBC_01730 TaxID=2975998 RepID=UPI002E10EAB5|nr:GNAT family N-acetyltransferase [Nocardia sp. NBC_01730]